MNSFFALPAAPGKSLSQAGERARGSGNGRERRRAVENPQIFFAGFHNSTLFAGFFRVKL
ncbi:MAG: hypothetical protein PT958_00880 [Firmicutes bacterium]|nr:hypothetical protein [Bacillota bacterium]